MIKLTTYPSGKTYTYKTKQEALREIKDNGLTRHQYTLVDTEKDTIFKSGIWLTKEEFSYYQNGYSITYIKFLRKKKYIGGTKK